MIPLLLSSCLLSCVCSGCRVVFVLAVSKNRVNTVVAGRTIIENSGSSLVVVVDGMQWAVSSSWAVLHSRFTSDELFQKAAYQLGSFRTSIGPFVTKSCLLAVSWASNTDP